MQTTKLLLCAAVLASAILSPSIHAAAEKEPDAEAARKDSEWKGQIQKELERKVSFEFVDTPFEEAVAFLRSLAKTSLIVAPSVENAGNLKIPLSLRVQDMPLNEALTWLCRIANCRFELKDRAIYISLTPEAETKAGAEIKAAARISAPEAPKNEAKGTRLRVRLAGGEEIEADSDLLNHYPGLVEELLDRAIDPAQDGFLAYRTVKEGLGATAADLAKLVTAFAPKAKTEFQADAGLLLVTAEDAADLRRVAARLRLQGIYRAHGPEKSALNAEPAAGPVSMPPAQPAPAERVPNSKVLGVKAERDLVMVSVGSAQGVKAGMNLTFKRGDKIIAVGAVERVYPDMCSVRVKDAKEIPQVHDDVIFPDAPQKAARNKIVQDHQANLKDNDDAIREAAAEMLGIIEAKEAVPDLIEALMDKNAVVAVKAHGSLVKITGQNFGYKNHAQWKKWWEEQKDK